MESEVFDFQGYEYIFKNSNSKLHQDAARIRALSKEFIEDVMFNRELSVVTRKIKKLAHEEDEQQKAQGLKNRLECSTEFIDRLINYNYDNLRVAITNLKKALRAGNLLNEANIFTEEYLKSMDTIAYVGLAETMFDAMFPQPDSKLELVKEFFQYILQHTNTESEFVEFKQAIQCYFSDHMLPLTVLNEYKTEFTVEEFHQLGNLLMRANVEISTEKTTEKMLELDLPDSALSKHSQEKVLELNSPDSVLGEHSKEGEQKSELELT